MILIKSWTILSEFGNIHLLIKFNCKILSNNFNTFILHTLQNCLYKSNEMFLESIFYFIIIYHFLLYVSALSHHQAEPRTRENIHTNTGCIFLRMCSWCVYETQHKVLGIQYKCLLIFEDLLYCFCLNIRIHVFTYIYIIYIYIYIYINIYIIYIYIIIMFLKG